jgi:uncharacterized membrane protein
MSAGAERRVAIDWMRGIVMVLMTIDHASFHYNKGRVADDSAASYVAGAALPVAQFFTRWITHLCAPTFVFLAGTALALSVAKRQHAGEPERTITRDIVIRGVVIAGLDLTYMSLLAQTTLLQVLYAIGASLLMLAFLRRLPTVALLVIALMGIACTELLALSFWDPKATPPLVLSLFWVPTFSRGLVIIYPVLPWLWMMLLGWCFGRVIVRAQQSASATLSPTQWLTRCGMAGLVTFTLIRGANGYGNMLLYRADASLVQWLHVSKYPPGITYTTLELGIMALLLAVLMKREASRATPPNANHPLLVFGQTALFYYVTHQLVLGASAILTGLQGKGGLIGAYVAALLCALLLYPACRSYRTLKARHPQSLLRYL